MQGDFDHGQLHARALELEKKHEQVSLLIPRASHADDDFSLGVPLPEVAQGLWVFA